MLYNCTHMARVGSKGLTVSHLHFLTYSSQWHVASKNLMVGSLFDVIQMPAKLLL